MRVYLFYRWHLKELMCHLYLYKHDMINSEEIWRQGQCTGSNKINGDLENLPGNKLCVDLIGPTTRRKSSPKFNILLKMFSLNPPYQKVYTTHKKSMTIDTSVDILCTTDYYHSQVLSEVSWCNTGSHDIIAWLKIYQKAPNKSFNWNI